MKDETFGVIVGVIGGSILTAAAFGLSGVGMAGTNGYCSALGGVSITYNVCNVNGKVVEVK